MIVNGKYMGVTDENPFPGTYELPYWANEKVRQCYLECAKKGVTPPNEATLNNLPATIYQIAGSPFTLRDNILSYASEWSIVPATDIEESVCEQLFYTNRLLKKLDLSSLTQITGVRACDSMCTDCNALTDLYISNLEVINADYACYATFSACLSLTSTGLHNLKSIYGNYACYHMYHRCTSLTEACCENLESVNGQGAMGGMFTNTKVKIVRFNKLKSIYGSAAFDNTFSNCSELTDIYFPLLETIESNIVFGSAYAANMLSGCSNVTVHFLSSMQTVIGDWAAVRTGFGGTNTTVLFDLGIDCEITVPAYTKMYINQFELDNLSSESATTFNLTFAPGEQQVIAYMSVNSDSEYNGCLVKTTINVSDENNQIVFDFGDYEYGSVHITANVPMSYYNVTVSNSFQSVNVPLKPNGLNVANYGTPAQVFGVAEDLDYEMMEPLNIVFTGEDEIELEFLAAQEIVTIDASNIEELITLDGYWGIQTVDGIDYITIHPTIANTYQDSKGIILEFAAETRRKIRVIVNAYVSSEANYDFGFVSYGTQQIYPTAAELKKGTISNGYYIYRDSGTNHSLTTYTMDILDSWILYADGNVVTIGWGQDSSTVTGTNTLYVESITVKLF